MELSKRTHDEILQWAKSHPTVEVCGLVKRSPVTGSESVVPMRNVHPKPEAHFMWDVEDMKQVYREMDLEFEHPIAYYHSHPDGNAQPSPMDMGAAFDTEIKYLIAYPMTPMHWELTAWSCIEVGVLMGEPLRLILP